MKRHNAWVFVYCIQNHCVHYIYFILDIDECATGMSDYDANANCTNTIGNFVVQVTTGLAQVVKWVTQVLQRLVYSHC